MKRIEAIVEAEEIGKVRDALWELGIRTMRVTEVEGERVLVARDGIGTSPEIEPDERPRARVSVIVPDDITDRVILTLLATVKGGGLDDGSRFVSSIERVVRLEATGYFDDVL